MAEPELPPARTRARQPRARKTAVPIAQAIVDEITDRGYAPGTKLATEKEMVARYGVGRGTLRESLRFLELSGVIVLRAGPSGGPIVAAPDAHDLAGLLGLFLQLRPTPFASIIEARCVLEPQIARLAASEASNEAIAAITTSIDAMERYIDDEEAFLIENEAFHEAVAAASGNTLFSLLISSLHLITDGMPLGVSYPLQRRKAVVRAHRLIADALIGRDPDAAEQAMAEHLAEFRRYVQKKFPGVSEKLLRWTDIAP